MKKKVQKIYNYVRVTWFLWQEILSGRASRQLKITSQYGDKQLLLVEYTKAFFAELPIDLLETVQAIFLEKRHELKKEEIEKTVARYTRRWFLGWPKSQGGKQ